MGQGAPLSRKRFPPKRATLIVARARNAENKQNKKGIRNAYCRSCPRQKGVGKPTAHLVGHGGVGLHYVHDPTVAEVSPAAQVLRRRIDRAGVLVNADRVKAAARLGGVSGALTRASGIAAPGGVVGVHAAEALETMKKIIRVLLNHSKVDPEGKLFI